MWTMSNHASNFTSLGPSDIHWYPQPSTMRMFDHQETWGCQEQNVASLPLLHRTSQVCSRDLGRHEVGGTLLSLVGSAAEVRSFLDFPTVGCTQKFYIGWHPKNDETCPSKNWKVILQIHGYLEEIHSFGAWSWCWFQQFVLDQKEGSCLLWDMLLKDMGMQTCPWTLYACL